MTQFECNGVLDLCNNQVKIDESKFFYNVSPVHWHVWNYFALNIKVWLCSDDSTQKSHCQEILGRWTAVDSNECKNWVFILSTVCAWHLTTTLSFSSTHSVVRYCQTPSKRMMQHFWRFCLKTHNPWITWLFKVIISYQPRKLLKWELRTCRIAVWFLYYCYS